MKKFSAYEVRNEAEILTTRDKPSDNRIGEMLKAFAELLELQPIKSEIVLESTNNIADSEHQKK